MTAISIAGSSYFRDPLVHIFSFLDPLTLVKTKRVCKLWKGVSQKEALWKSLAKQRGLNQEESPEKSVIRSLKMEKSLEEGELKHLQTLEGHTDAVTTLFFMNGQLFSGSADSTIKVWEKKEERWLNTQTLIGHTDAVTAIAYLDGKLLTQSKDNIIKMWEKKEGLWTASETKKGNFTSFSGNTATLGKFLIHGYIHGDIQTMDKENGIWRKLNLGKKKHSGLVNSILYSDCEGLLFSGSYDHTVRVWGQK